MNHLERALAPIGRRMRLQRTVSWAVIGLFAGAVCALLLRGASFLWAFPAVARWSVAAFLGIPVLCALVSWLWPVTPMDAAREADASGLYARAQTALMCSAGILWIALKSLNPAACSPSARLSRR